MSQIKHKDIEIPENNPFTNCKLNRATEGEYLTNLITKVSGNYTLAINDRWGRGKTTFVKMWEASLKQKGYHTIYLNAWENDIVSEPLVCILGEILPLITDDSSKAKLLEHSTALVKNWKKLVPEVVKSLAMLLSPFIGDLPKEITDSLINAPEDSLRKEIEGYKEQQTEILQFKQNLAECIQKKCEKKPLIFIVDELDRCRPDYAVDLLEKVKHFFSVEGIVFVLSIDKDQLVSSIKGRYGSESIDGNAYLKRFIDFEYIPKEPDMEKFCTYLYHYMGMDEFLGTREKSAKTGRQDEKNFLSVATQLYTQKGLSLRDVERMFSHIRLALLMLPEDKMNLPFMAEMLTLLTFLKTYEPNFYARMKNKGLEIQSFVDQLGEIFHKNLLKSEDKFDFWYTFVSLIISYHTYQDNPKDRRPLMRTDNATGLMALNIKFPSWVDKNFMERNIKNIKYFSQEEYDLHTIIELLDLRTF
ncbi:MAG: KAP family P-loop NTPase fold protein [Porphyromonas endodontalis]|uniref:KAP family P-loop NTPase fold protein n=1 Tax=Porphyromonas endodontalis TaxID=28124 RepID=UPI003FA18473